VSQPTPARRDVVVIGAGASGLACAAACGARGRSVLVVDHAERAAAKVRISGGGRCNFTNRDVAAEHYLSQNPHFCKSALARFRPADIVARLERRGIRYREREAGQLFCEESARQVVEMLLDDCRGAGAEVRLGCRVAAVERGDGFTVRTSLGDVRAAAVVVATGGLSYPKLGATGLGFELARQFGLAVVPPRPALVPFVFARPLRDALQGLAGISLDAGLACGGRRWTGKVLFTHRGLSGPAALQASLRWQPGEPLTVDLLPGGDAREALAAKRRSRVETKTALAGLLPRRLAEAWCALSGVAGPIDQLPERRLRELAAGLHAWEIVPGGTEGYATAEVTAGGVDTAELSSTTLEARRVPGLHFVGEVVDVTGALGGYNLHWAFASGVAAGGSAGG
jgi:predicted Rossmann fold flavoprotein